jgi:hypothetical protein
VSSNRMSEAAREQRRRAATKHGAVALKRHGAVTLDATGRSRMAELSEIVQTRPGVLSLLHERCVKAILMAELIEAYIVEQKKIGKELESIPVLRYLPAYQNSAQRCVNLLLHELRDDADVLDAGKVLDAVRIGNENPEG